MNLTFTTNQKISNEKQMNLITPNEQKLQLLREKAKVVQNRKVCRQENSLGRTLKEYRKRKGLSQDELATMLNVSQALVSAYESGKQVIDYEEMLDLCQILEINPLAFFSKALEKSKKLGSKIELTIEDHEIQANKYDIAMKDLLRDKINELHELIDN